MTKTNEDLLEENLQVYIKENIRLRKALKKYGQHFPSCAKVLARLQGAEVDCSCGFDKAVQ